TAWPTRRRCWRRLDPAARLGWRAAGTRCVAGPVRARRGRGHRDHAGREDAVHRWHGLEAVPGGWGRSVVTIGVFDGVHRGHQRIIGQAVARARDLGLASVVVTFDPHPSEVVRPGTHPAVLTEPARRAELIEELGVDALCVIPF